MLTTLRRYGSLLRRCRAIALIVLLPALSWAQAPVEFEIRGTVTDPTTGLAASRTIPMNGSAAHHLELTYDDHPAMVSIHVVEADEPLRDQIVAAPLSPGRPAESANLPDNALVFWPCPDPGTGRVRYPRTSVCTRSSCP